MQCKLRTICRSIPTVTVQTLVVSLVLSRFDSENATLVGLPIYLQRQMQSVLNLSARLFSNYCGPSPFHWLQVSEWIKHNTVLLTFRLCLDTSLRVWFVSQTFQCIVDCDCDLWQPLLTNRLYTITSVHFLLSDQLYGISYRLMLLLPRCLRIFTGSSNLIYFKFLFLTLFRLIIIFHSVCIFSGLRNALCQSTLKANCTILLLT